MIHRDAAIDNASDDRLDRDRIARAFAGMLDDPAVLTPLTVGIFGGWGTGKTSLMRLLAARLQTSASACKNSAVTLWFDAWTYAREEQSLWRALLLRITGELRERADYLTLDEKAAKELQEKLGQLETSLYRSLTLKTNEHLRINWGAAVPFAVDTALRYATGGATDLRKALKLLKGDEAEEVAKFIERKSQEVYIDEVRSLEQFRSTFEQALRLVGIGGVGGSRRLYIFVDDLDRCLPEDAVSAIEAIKLFLDIDGCVFILGMDATVVQSGIRARYARHFEGSEPPFQAADYLDKIIQLPFHLPPLGREQVALLLKGFCDDDTTGLLEDCRELIEIAVPDNPRTLKRALNVLRLAAELTGCVADTTGGDRQALCKTRQRLAKLMLMQLCFQEAYELVVREGFETLKKLEELSFSGAANATYGPILKGRLRQLLRQPGSTFDTMGGGFPALLSMVRALEAPTAAQH